MDRDEIEREAARLNKMADEVLGFNLQDASADDHIGAAEALLAFYERTVKMQLTVAFAEGIDIDDEGSLVFFRRAADLHIKIAQAMQ